MKRNLVYNQLKALDIIKRNLSVSSRLKTERLASIYNEEYKRSLSQPEAYWDEKKNLIEWYKQPRLILDKSNSPFEKWYVDGTLNATYNCLDIHVKNGFGDQVALIHDSPLTGVIEKITYKKLLEEVSELKYFVTFFKTLN